MNGSYYKNPTFPPNMRPNTIEHIPNEEIFQGQLGFENELSKNKGKKVTVFLSYCAEEEKPRKIAGIIETSTVDHLILSDPDTGKWYLIPVSNINYMEFNEKINYRL